MTQLQQKNIPNLNVTDAMSLRAVLVRDHFDSNNIDALLISRDCDIHYFTGFCGHDSLLLLHQTGAACISDNRYDEQLNPVKDSSLAEVVMGVRHRLPLTVADLCKSLGISKLGIQSGHMSVAGKDALEAAIPDCSVVATGELVEVARMCKDETEISLIERAIEINEQALRAMLTQLRLGMTEREIAALLEYEMKRNGADGIGFSSIVAVGANGSLPHYEVGEAELTENTSLLVDWGCLKDGYNSDLTRSFGIGTMPEKIAEIYQIVLDAQLAAIDAAAPGKICAEIDAVARKHITNAGYGDYFGHGLGHGMGLEVHEAPYFNDLQTDVILKPGMVMTVEPGIYLPGIGGVRIEDDIVITESGCRVLSSMKKDIDWATITPTGGGA